MGEYINGNQPSAISAVSSTFFNPTAAKYIGISSLNGCSINFNGLPKPVVPSPDNGKS